MSNSRVTKLEKTLTEAQDAYYNGTPVMDDDEYDALADELASLSPKNKVLRRVGASASDDSKLQKVKHVIPMGSQKKVNTQDDFEKWAKKTRSLSFVVQEKLDGLSVELVYKKGKLVQAITRGDGETGEDITHNVVHMMNVFKRLPKFSGSLRGEIIFPLKAFEKHVQKNDPDANPRNTAAGLSRRKTVDKRMLSRIKILYFDCDDNKVKFDREHHKIRFMEKKLGLECVFTKVVDLKNAIKGHKSYADKLRAKLDHEIDGLVYKVNGIKRQTALGVTNGRPKGQIAWKFAAEMRKTRLEDVSWEVGLTGRITPVAHVTPVRVGGVTIRKASLHNVDNMQRLGVYPLAEVLVSRRNDVIPYLEQVVARGKSKQPGIFFTPEDCPICGEDTEFEGAYLMCVNPNCPARTRGDIVKWVKVLDIDQVGISFINAAIKAKFIADAADLYTLSVDTIETLDGYQRKSAKTIVHNVNKTRELPIIKFMAALNIPGIGHGTFRALERAGFDRIDKVLHASVPEMALVGGIGRTTASGLKNGLALKLDLIKKLQTNGVRVKKKIIGKLNGKSFCFTGQISIKRGDAMKLVESLGGEVKTSVGKGLTYLVQATKTSASGKSQKAQKYGTEVLGEKEFFKIVDYSFKRLQSLA